MRSVLLLSSSVVLFFEDLRWSQAKVVSAIMKIAKKLRTTEAAIIYSEFSLSGEGHEA